MTEEKTTNGSVKTEKTMQENAISAAGQNLQEIVTATEENTPVNTSGNEAENTTSLKEQITNLENKMLMQKLNVNEAYADDLLTFAKSKVDDKTTMQQAIKELVEKYPFFKKVIPSITTNAGTTNESLLRSKDGFASGLIGDISNED